MKLASGRLRPRGTPTDSIISSLLQILLSGEDPINDFIRWHYHDLENSRLFFRARCRSFEWGFGEGTGFVVVLKMVVISSSS